MQIREANSGIESGDVRDRNSNRPFSARNWGAVRIVDGLVKPSWLRYRFLPEPGGTG